MRMHSHRPPLLHVTLCGKRYRRVATYLERVQTGCSPRRDDDRSLRSGQSIRETSGAYDVANCVHPLDEDSESGAWTYPSCSGCRTKDNKWSRSFASIWKDGQRYASELHATLNHVGPQASPIQIPAPKQMLELHTWVISTPVDSYWILSRRIQIQTSFLFKCQPRQV